MKIYDILICRWNCLDCDSTCDHHTNYQDLCRKGKSYNGQNKCFECWKNKFEVEPKFYRKAHCYAKHIGARHFMHNVAAVGRDKY